MVAEAEVIRKKARPGSDRQMVYIHCSECKSMLWSTSVYLGEEPYTNLEAIQDHLDQHNDPTRAPDIEYLEYNVEAWCTICEDRVGEVDFTSSGTLECNVCGTVWDSDGEHGEREV